MNLLARRYAAFGILIAGLALSQSVAAAFTAYIDRFAIVRDGLSATDPLARGTFFADNFDDGQPPPSAPPYPNGSSAVYGVLGTFAAGAESGGVLTLNTLQGATVFNAAGAPRTGLRATLRTSIDPDPAFANFGLRQRFYFDGGGLFRLDGLPAAPGDTVAIEVNDEKIGLPAEERLQIALRRGSVTDPSDTESLWLIYLKQTFTPGGGINIISETEFPDAPAGANAFSLGLIHEADSLGFSAFYRFLDGTTPLSDRVLLPGTGTMFDGEDHVRMAFFASEIPQIPEPQSWALLMLGIAMGLSLARRKA